MTSRTRLWVLAVSTPIIAFAFLACLAVSILLTPAVAQGQVQAQHGILETLWKWTPLLFWGPKGEIGGFALNILVSFLAMAIGTMLGLGLGLMQERVALFGGTLRLGPRTGGGFMVRARLPLDDAAQPTDRSAVGV